VVFGHLGCGNLSSQIWSTVQFVNMLPTRRFILGFYLLSLSTMTLGALHNTGSITVTAHSELNSAGEHPLIWGAPEAGRQYAILYSHDINYGGRG